MSQQILPFYLVCDESSSMEGAPIDAINRALPELHKEIGSNPVIADKIRFCLIGFSDVAQVLLPLADLSTVASVPELTADGGTDYGKALDLLRDTIAKDVAVLKAASHQVYRPAVFILTDGQPNDTAEWPAAHRRLTDANWTARPNILAFGFGQADKQTIKQLATIRAFIADGSLSPAQALSEFAQSLVNSMVRSGAQSAADPSGGATLSVPDEVPGFETIKLPVV